MTMGTIHKIWLFLSVFALCNCAGKKEMTKSRSETDYADCMRLALTEIRSDSLETARVSEQTMTENETDSIVEKLRERIVTDSCGNIVLFEKEHVQEHYKNRGKKNTSSNRGSETASKTANQEKSVEGDDSIRKTASTEIAKEVHRHPLRAVHIVGILALLLVGFILLKVRK